MSVYSGPRSTIWRYCLQRNASDELNRQLIVRMVTRSALFFHSVVLQATMRYHP